MNRVRGYNMQQIEIEMHEYVYELEYINSFINRWEEGHESPVQETLLVDEYIKWCKWRKLPEMSADEMLIAIQDNINSINKEELDKYE